MSKIFLDTNVLMYAYDLTQPAKRQRALQLLSKSGHAGSSPTISTQVLQEFYNRLTRKLKIAPKDAAVELKNLLTLDIVILTAPLILAATDLHASTSISFWDALIVAAAQAANCDEIWTEDLNTGQVYGKLKVVNPLASA